MLSLVCLFVFPIKTNKQPSFLGINIFFLGTEGTTETKEKSLSTIVRNLYCCYQPLSETSPWSLRSLGSLRSLLSLSTIVRDISSVSLVSFFVCLFVLPIKTNKQTTSAPYRLRVYKSIPVKVACVVLLSHVFPRVFVGI